MTSCVIGQAIKEAIHEAGKTVDAVAQDVPADPRSVFRWQIGGANPDIVARLAEVLHSRKLVETFCSQCPVKRVKLKKAQKKKEPRIVFKFRGCKIYLNPFYIKAS